MFDKQLQTVYTASIEHKLSFHIPNHPYTKIIVLSSTILGRLVYRYRRKIHFSFLAHCSKIHIEVENTEGPILPLTTKDLTSSF